MIDKSDPIVLYDGECGLCNTAVQFIIRNDPVGRFKFCSLQSETAARLLQGKDIESASPDTVVLLEAGNVYLRSTAALKIARQLRPPWRFFAILLLIPAPLRDMVYKQIAANRHRMFKSAAVCLAPTSEMRARFLDIDEPPQTGIISSASV